MRGTFLIAWREYKEYVFSRGFLLLLIFAPLGLLAMFTIFRTIENSSPQRHFTVVDQTGQFASDIELYFERKNAQRIISAWDNYVRDAFERLPDNTGKSVNDLLPVPFVPAPITKDRMTAFALAGGVEEANRIAGQSIAKNQAPFDPPVISVRYHKATSALANAPDRDAAVAIFRPFLNGDAPYPGINRDIDQAGQLAAVLLLPKDYRHDENIAAEYWSRNLVDLDMRTRISQALSWAVRKNNAKKLGLSESDFEAVSAQGVSINNFRPDRASEEAELTIKDQVETGMPAFMTYVLFFLIFSVGSLLLTNTIEERSNKIVEMLLSSVTADQLMIGKLIGIGAVGLTIPAIGLVVLGIAASTVLAGNEYAYEIMASLLFSPLVWIYLFYFLCGYIIFAMMYLAIGAVSNSIQDAQTFLGPVTLIIIAPIPLMALVFQHPNGLIASIMTWIPIYTPYAVMLRAASDPPLWEIIGATALMLVFAFVFARLMGRIFRRGLLNDAPQNLLGLLRMAGKK